MEYRELAKLYHMDNSSERDAHIKKELASRLEDPSTFRLGITINDDELFICVPRDLNILTQRILRRERKISKLMSSLPGIAGFAVLRGLVIDEVVMSNDIENIHSTRRQIDEALASMKGDALQTKRFRELAKLYINITFGEATKPKTPQDIRDIYDVIMVGENLDDPPDGKIFRKDTVDVVDGIKAVHSGILPESAIIDLIEEMLAMIDSIELPELYSALASHYIFEYTHPFYDGNGRTGRYLLSLFLEEPLSKPTAVSLSRTISENRSAYYQAFKQAEDPLNHGELTFFVLTMLDLIFKAQDELIVRLDKNARILDMLKCDMDKLSKTNDYQEKESELIFGMAQQAAFGVSPDLDIDELAKLISLKRQQTRQYLSRMEEAGTVVKVRGRNPLTFALAKPFLYTAFPELEESIAAQ